MTRKNTIFQFHQLLARIRLELGARGYPTDVDDLPRYAEVGVTSIRPDANRTEHEQAVLALAKDIGSSIESVELDDTGESTQSELSEFS